MKVGFIGAGNMAGAIIRGMVAGGFRGSDLVAYDTDSAKLIRLFEDCGICMTTSAVEAAEQADALVLAVKPQVLPSVLPGLSPALHRRGPLVISIAAGKPLVWLEELMGPGLPVVRVMPNIAAKVGESMSAFCGNARVNEAHKGIVRQIFETVGETVELEERLFSAYSALAGCSPAFTLLYIDALAEAGVRYGIPKPTALKIVSQAVLGTTRLLQETEEHPRALIDQVCSPAGTTIEGVCALQAGGFEAAVLAAAKASYEKDLAL
ncbi:MAG TPA: pyrroline-5-carboxylate reductase [Firmicutes bacterium]|nr:pyrroline-5-carboxylate reductase [Bacillota bacterium]